MRVVKMKATFGRLESAVLELTEGLNLLETPNEGGKSTWCAFLRAMLYGVPTKERDRAGYIAEKNRYQPWSGAAMEGEVDLLWGNAAITLRRFQKGSAAFGGFEAVYTGTGEPVPGLTGDNVGETLLGVPREVFERSAFVGQSAVLVDGSPELEKRIAALVSSGEEDVSYSQTQRRLRDWQNRRKHNKSGLIPKLEAELLELDGVLSRLDRVGRALAEAQGECTALRAKEYELSAEESAQQARLDRTRRAEYDKAVEYLSQCRAEVAALSQESGPLPTYEVLRAAQGELAFFNTLGTNLKMAERELAQAQARLEAAKAESQDPIFSGLTAVEAMAQAQADCESVRKGLKKSWYWLVMLLCCTGIGLWQLLGPGHVVLGGGLLALALGCTLRFLWSKKKQGDAKAILARYDAQTPNDLLLRGETYGQLWTQAREVEQEMLAISASIRQMSTQREELHQRLLALVRPFAPSVTDFFGISAAISKALSLDERMATARARLEGAQKLVSSIPAPLGNPVESPAEAPTTDRSLQQTTALLSAVRAELKRAEPALAMALGERNTLGDPVVLESRRGTVQEELELRREEYDALDLALTVLDEANADLQARFSPALSRLAGELFAALTGGKYADVTLTRTFEVLAREEGAVLPRRSLTLSQGTVDQLYLAVRLAVCSLALPAGEPAPLVLDDVLANFDDGRMGLALALLERLSAQRQILLFTCHSRENRWLDLNSGAK